MHLFGNEKGEGEEFSRGALVFYPTWFDKIGFEVINPHNRARRAGTQPIYYEVVTPGLLDKIEKLVTLPDIDYEHLGERFDDPMARRVPWTPVKPGEGASFRSYRLVKVNPSRLEFRRTVTIRLLYGMSVAIGLVTWVFFGFAPRANPIDDIFLMIPLIGGSFFAVLGIVMLFRGKRIVFDRAVGRFWDKKGHLAGGSLSDIYAIQIIPKKCYAGKDIFYAHELNLVTRNGDRINVLNHGDLEAMRKDARVLSKFLGVPVWDGGVDAMAKYKRSPTITDLSE